MYSIEEIFPQNYLVNPKRMLQDYLKKLKKCFLVIEVQSDEQMTIDGIRPQHPTFLKVYINTKITSQ